MSVKKLFILDLIGAAISALLLGVVLVKYNHLIGMPIHILRLLATLAIIFMLYDSACLLLQKADRKPHLRIIAFANLGYVVLSLILLVRHSATLTTLGYVYFILEKIILVIISSVELKASRT